MDRLRASQATSKVDPDKGLTNLAHEFAIDDMSEVLAGLRAQQPQRPGLGVEHRGRPDHCSEVRKCRPTGLPDVGSAQPIAPWIAIELMG